MRGSVIHASRARVPRRAGPWRESPVLRGSVWLLVAMALQAATAAVYWFLASKAASSEALGNASALYTQVQFVNYATGLGLTVALARFALGTSRADDAAFGWACVLTVISSVALAAPYLAVIDSASTRLLRSSTWGTAGFVVVSASMSVALLVDVRLMACRRWGWLLTKVGVIGFARLPLVLWHPLHSEAVWLFWVVVIPQALGGPLGIVLLRLIGAGRMRLRPWAGLSAVFRFAGVNWVAALASQAPQFLLPLIVALEVSASENANFFLAWTATTLVLLAPAAISQVLLTEGSKVADDRRTTEGRSLEALGLSVALAAVAFVLALAVKPLIVPVFGASYRTTADVLPWLVLAGVPWAFASVRLSQARLARDHFTTVAITLVLAVGTLVPAATLVRGHGVGGVTLAWLAGNVAASITAPVCRWARASVAVGRRLRMAQQ